jgi:hypothetical protein
VHLLVFSLKIRHNERCGTYKKLHESLKLLNLDPLLYIEMQNAVVLNTCRIVRNISTEQWLISAWSVRPKCFEKQLNCCEERKVDDHVDYNNNNNNNNWVADPSGRTVNGEGLRPIACWDCGFESQAVVLIIVSCEFKEQMLLNS